MAATQDELLVEKALRMALQQRCPRTGLLHHSDRGCQYTSQQYQQVLSQFGISVSMSRRGNCYDNAVSESFFGTLKRECVDRTRFQTRAQAKQAIFEYTECFYNRVRRHSTLGYKSPAVYEQLMC
jgi:putative transposase